MTKKKSFNRRKLNCLPNSDEPMGRILNLCLNTSHLGKGVGDLGFLGGSVGQEAKCNGGDTGDAD